MLEDHLGDIVRKAREAANLTVEQVAAVSGLTTDAYGEFETSGLPSPKLQLAAAAKILGLNPSKLATIAAGWMPKPVELSGWRELRMISTSSGGNTVNCYLVWDEISREAALFDTGWDAQSVLKEIAANGLNLRHLFLTHTHEDHIAAMAGLRAAFPKLLPHTNAKSAPPQHRNRANDFLHLGNLRITNRECPGHAEDGVIYIVGNWPEDAPHVAIPGDTLFAGSIATGFQSAELLKQKIREQILTLPSETLLCPGHGPLTTVAEEKANNPFF